MEKRVFWKSLIGVSRYKGHCCMKQLSLRTSDKHNVTHSLLKKILAFVLLTPTLTTPKNLRVWQNKTCNGDPPDPFSHHQYKRKKQSDYCHQCASVTTAIKCNQNRVYVHIKFDHIFGFQT